jgi:hypothetical protein
VNIFVKIISSLNFYYRKIWLGSIWDGPIWDGLDPYGMGWAHMEWIGSIWDGLGPWAGPIPCFINSPLFLNHFLKKILKWFVVRNVKNVVKHLLSSYYVFYIYHGIVYVLYVLLYY